MTDTALAPAPTPHTNEDPLPPEHGTHPVASGVGAAGGGMAGGALGLALGGPIGGAIGAIIGALAGSLGGGAVGEALEPSAPAPEEPAHWHEVIPSGLPSYEEIALRAYFLYEQEGRPEGQAIRHWLLAEESLRAETAVI